MFLNPTLFEEIFIKPIKYLERIFPKLKEKNVYLKLNKALYSLKQSPYKWFEMVKSIFAAFRLRAAYLDSNFFLGKGVLILLFVDDILIVGAY
jgi:hypothetical protein